WLAAPGAPGTTSSSCAFHDRAWEPELSMSDITVFVARRIITMDPGRPTARAIAVRDGRILSVGTIESMQPWLRRYSHIMDETFADQVLLPGFIDPHTHLS